MYPRFRMEIRYLKYCHWEYIARLLPNRPNCCTLWAQYTQNDTFTGKYKSKVFLGTFKYGVLEKERGLWERRFEYDWSILRGSEMLYEKVVNRFARDVERVYTNYMAERRNVGRPSNLKAVKATAALLATNSELSDRELAKLLEVKLRRKRVDPKSAWRWKQTVLSSVAKL